MLHPGELRGPGWGSAAEQGVDEGAEAPSDVAEPEAEGDSSSDADPAEDAGE